MTQNLVDQAALTKYVESRGYRIQRVFNDTEFCGVESVELRVVGLRLVGPRGSKGFVPANETGLYDRDTAALWCDGIDYSTKKLLEAGLEKVRISELKRSQRHG